MPNEKKFSFIIERKDERLYGKLMESLTQLEVPAGYQADIIDVQGCTGRAAAYNAGMQRSDAKYKLYVTEDCILLRHDLLYKLLEIFQSDSQIGLIGCSGAEVLPTSGLTFDARKRLGKLRFASGGNNIGTDFSSSVKDAEALDDFFLATQYDLIWREDLFPAGESFVATAACMEFRRQGYRCTVPKEDEA